MNHFNKAPPQALACGGALFLHRISLLLRMAPERIGTFSPFSNPFPPCLFHAAFFPICALFANMWTFSGRPFHPHRTPLPKSKAPAGSTLCMEPAGAFLYGYKQRSSYTIADSRPTLASSRKRGGNREPVLSVRPTPRLFSAENLGPAAIISRRTCSRCSRSTSCGAPCRPLRADGKPLCGGMH